EAQSRLTVAPGISTGSPARRAAMRAMFQPCSPSGCAQPRMTSSIVDLSRAGPRASTPLIAVAARSSGRVVESAPLGAGPTGVRTAATRTASGMERSCGAVIERSQQPVGSLLDGKTHDGQAGWSQNVAISPEYR